MSNLSNARFDDSEDEDDFNPIQADLSDAEDGEGLGHDDDAGAQIQNEAARSREVNDESDEEPAVLRRRSSADEHGGNEDEDEEDAEGEGEDTVPGANEDEDEEDEEEDDEEEITVSIQKFL
jgi:transcription elongation factor SPT5